MQEGNKLRFVATSQDTSKHSHPDYHSLYYKHLYTQTASFETETQEEERHPLDGNPHNFLRKFHTCYDIVQSFAPSLLPELAPAFHWDSRKDNFTATQIPFTLTPHTSLDLGTYFNSLYITVVESLIGPRSFYVFLDFEGVLNLEVYAVTIHGQREVLFQKTLQQPVRGWAVVPIPPVVIQLQPHRIALQIKTKRQSATIYGLHYATPEKATNSGQNLAVLIRTFNRKHECKRLIATLASSPSLNVDSVHLLLYDASSAFSSSDLSAVCGNMRLTHLQGANYGSSGNLVVLLNHLRQSSTPRELEATTAIILDDDILVHPESLLRAWFLAAHSLSEKTIIVGSFLDRCRPMNIDATVALYGADLKRDAAMHLQPLRGGYRIDNPYYLDLSCQPVGGNAAAFYLLVARASLLTSVFPLPLFLKWDDIDYTATLHSCGANLVSVPGVSIWHDAFYDCMPVWQEVLNLKHGLIVDMVHLQHTWQAVYKSIRDILFRHLMVFDYDICESMLESVAEVLNGPAPHSPIEMLESSALQVAQLTAKYHTLRDSAVRLVPDSRTLTSCLSTGAPCSLSDGTNAIVVHELYPNCMRSDTNIFIKHAGNASRSLVLRYEQGRHETIVRRILQFSSLRDEFARARERWRTTSANLRSHEQWQTVTARFKSANE